MKPVAVALLSGVALLTLAAVSQTQLPNAATPPAKKAPENLPWTRFHPAAAPYQPSDAEKQQIHAKIDQLGAAIRDLRSSRGDDPLLPDIEIYYEAARWKMAYPEEFFRPK